MFLDGELKSRRSSEMQERWRVDTICAACFDVRKHQLFGEQTRRSLGGVGEDCILH